MSTQISIRDDIMDKIRKDRQYKTDLDGMQVPEVPSDVLDRWNRESMELREMVGTTGKKPGKV